MTILVQQLRAEIEQLQAKIVQLEKSLKLVQSHANTAYSRGRQAGIADQEHMAREAMVAMNLARDQMMDENERFTDLLEKAEQERDQLKAENAELRPNALRFRHVLQQLPASLSQAFCGENLCHDDEIIEAIDQAMTKEQP